MGECDLLVTTRKRAGGNLEVVSMGASFVVTK
jgi:hypothetical protein